MAMNDVPEQYRNKRSCLMKRKEFVRQLVKDGCAFLRSGVNHDLYVNFVTGKK